MAEIRKAIAEDDTGESPVSPDPAKDDTIAGGEDLPDGEQDEQRADTAGDQGELDREGAEGGVDGEPEPAPERGSDGRRARDEETEGEDTGDVPLGGMDGDPQFISEMVVTHRFLDAIDTEARDNLAPNFHFLGAVRLEPDFPSGFFVRNSRSNEVIAIPI